MNNKNELIKDDKKDSNEEQCSHLRKDYWNHGYHCECLDCGEQLY